MITRNLFASLLTFGTLFAADDAAVAAPVNARTRRNAPAPRNTAPVAQTSDDDVFAAEGQETNSAPTALAEVPLVRPTGGTVQRIAAPSPASRQAAAPIKTEKPSPWLITPDADARTPKEMINSMMEKIRAIARADGHSEEQIAKLDGIFLTGKAHCAFDTPKLYFVSLAKVTAEMGRLPKAIEGFLQARDNDEEDLYFLQETESGDRIPAGYLVAVQRDGEQKAGSEDDGTFWSYNYVTLQTAVIRTDDEGNYFDEAQAPAAVLALTLLRDKEGVLRFQWKRAIYNIVPKDALGRTIQGGQRTNMLDTIEGAGWQNLEGRLLTMAQKAGCPLHMARVNTESREERNNTRRNRFANNWQAPEGFQNQFNGGDNRRQGLRNEAGGAADLFAE